MEVEDLVADNPGMLDVLIRDLSNQLFANPVVLVGRTRGQAVTR